jgi:hypothetical protein
MPCEPLHEAGITVPATVTTSDIGVDTVVKTGNSRFGQNGLGKDLSYLHIKYYNGAGGNSKVLLVFFPLLPGEEKGWRGKMQHAADPRRIQN